MKHYEIIDKLKTSRYIGETYEPLTWEDTVDFLESVLASDINPDTSDERIVELVAQYTAAANAAGYGLYQPERVLRRYLEMLRSFTA